MLGCYTIPPTILTPHVLSEWMVEVCAGDKCGVRVGEKDYRNHASLAFELVFQV